MNNETYKLGTKHGLLKQVYTRNQFTLCIEKFMSLEEATMDREVGEGRVKWPVRAKWPFNFSPLHRVHTTREPYQTVTADAVSIVCDL